MVLWGVERYKRREDTKGLSKEAEPFLEKRGEGGSEGARGWYRTSIGEKIKKGMKGWFFIIIKKAEEEEDSPVFSKMVQGVV
jgi:hypothetical protein